MRQRHVHQFAMIATILSASNRIFSASNALKPSTRPPFDSYFHALQEKWAIEHVIETFRTIQERQTPRASKSQILRIFLLFLLFC